MDYGWIRRKQTDKMTMMITKTCLKEEDGVAKNHDKEGQPDHTQDDHVPIDGHYSRFFSAVSLVKILPLARL
jgi:hypothetical protein